MNGLFSTPAVKTAPCLAVPSQRDATAPAPGLKLHLGCGRRVLPGYVHVDLADFPHVDHRHDVRRLPMFADDSVELVYASHVLEYFDRIEAAAVLEEWRRVLRPGGILRLAVPDFEALVNVYLETDNLDRILGPLYGRWPMAAGETGDPVCLYHRTAYDFRSLQQLLTRAGFRQPRRWDWRAVFVGELAGYDDYSQAYDPHLDKTHGRLTSLNVEAQK